MFMVKSFKIVILSIFFFLKKFSFLIWNVSLLTFTSIILLFISQVVLILVTSVSTLPFIPFSKKKKSPMNTIQLCKVLYKSGLEMYAMHNCNLHKMHSESSFPDNVNKNDSFSIT